MVFVTDISVMKRYVDWKPIWSVWCSSIITALIFQICFSQNATLPFLCSFNGHISRED